LFLKERNYGNYTIVYLKSSLTFTPSWFECRVGLALLVSSLAILPWMGRLPLHAVCWANCVQECVNLLSLSPKRFRPTFHRASIICGILASSICRGNIQTSYLLWVGNRETLLNSIFFQRDERCVKFKEFFLATANAKI